MYKTTDLCNPNKAMVKERRYEENKCLSPTNLLQHTFRGLFCSHLTLKITSAAGVILEGARKKNSVYTYPLEGHQEKMAVLCLLIAGNQLDFL